MKILKTGKNFTLGLLVLALSCGTAWAQVPMGNTQTGQQQQSTDYSKAELEKFVSITKKVQKVQQGMQQEMMGMINESSLDMATFQEISQKERQQKMGGNKESTSGESTEKYTEEQMKAYEEIMGKMEKKQKNMRSEMNAKIKAGGMKVEKYQQMSRSIQADKQLRQKVMKMLKGGQSGMQRQQGGQQMQKTK